MKGLLLCIFVLFFSSLVYSQCNIPTTCAKTVGSSCANTRCEISSLYCNTTSVSGEPFDYRCVSAKPLGTPCQSTDDCIVTGSTPSFCQQGVCRGFRQPGTPCDDDLQCTTSCSGGFCTGRGAGQRCSPGLCGKGLYCNQTLPGQSTSTFVCLPHRVEGEPCWTQATNNNCALGLLCVNNDLQDANISVCLPYGARSVGGICGDTYQCAAGLYCTGSRDKPGRCATVPTTTPSNRTCYLSDPVPCANPNERCLCLSNFTRNICTTPKVYTAEELAEPVYFASCAEQKPACYTNRYECDCDPQKLWNWATKRAVNDRYRFCDLRLDAYLSQGPPSAASGTTATSAATSASTSASSTATTRSSTTNSPTTSSPTTNSPTTNSPTANSPTTNSPTTNSPTTNSPTTNSPTTSSPTTNSPTTRSPSTSSSPSSSSSSTSSTTSPTIPPQVIAIITLKIEATFVNISAVNLTELQNSLAIALGVNFTALNLSIFRITAKRADKYQITVEVRQAVDAGSNATALSTAARTSVSNALANPSSPLAVAMVSAGANVTSPVQASTEITSTIATSSTSTATGTTSSSPSSAPSKAPTVSSSTTAGNSMSSASLLSFSFASLLLSLLCFV